MEIAYAPSRRVARTLARTLRLISLNPSPTPSPTPTPTPSQAREKTEMVATSPYISLYRPISRYISPHLPHQAREKTEAEMEEEAARAASTEGTLEYVDNKFATFSARTGL